MKKKYIKKIKYPPNYNFWLFVFKRSEEIEKFLMKGNKRQIEEIVLVLKYTKKKDVEKFKEINGKHWLKAFKEKNEKLHHKDKKNIRFC